MKVYHRTTETAADAILTTGFKDGTGRYGITQKHSGVWVSDCPLDANEGANGDVVLTMNIPAKVFARFEWVEEGKSYRESLIPASTLNQYGRPSIHEYDWGGCTEEEILETIAFQEREGTPWTLKRAKQLREEVLPFLKRRGLLAEAAPVPPAKPRTRRRKKQ
jgi:hypothetical protein